MTEEFDWRHDDRCLNNSNFTNITGSYRYDIALIKKYTSNETMNGFGAFENFPLKVAIETLEEEIK